jgi:signal transduction histidine kinase
MEANLKETEQKIILKNKDLERSNKVLDKFVNVVSHELKKPVSNMIGLLSILEPEVPRLSEKGKGVFDKMKYSAAQLKKMIVDLLEETKRDYTRDANFEMIDLAKIFEEVMLGMEHFIIDSKAKVVLNFKKSPVVFYPYQDLKSIISNLLSNAIKYRSPNRECHVNVESDIEAGGKRTMCFKDNGQGIDLARNGDLLFQKYQRFNTETDGSGLGLWIVKGILEKNGSRIEVESHPDKGTMFKIFF